MTAIAPTPEGHNVKPPPGPAEAPARTTPAELTDEQRGWLSEASRSDINGWLHITIKGSPAARGFQYGFLVADGTEFDAEEFLRQHPQWDWQRGYLKDRPQRPWTYIESRGTVEP